MTEEQSDAITDEMHTLLTRGFQERTGGQGGFVTNWLCVAETVFPDGETGWIWYSGSGQRLITSMGLVKWLEGVVEYEQTQSLIEYGRRDDEA